MTATGALTLADIISPADYAKNRGEWKRKIGALKRNRRVAVGPYVTFYFESRDTMWLQVQEMIYIEKGGMEQAAGNLQMIRRGVARAGASAGQSLAATALASHADGEVAGGEGRQQAE